MKRFALGVFALCVAVSALSAQGAPKKILASKDIDNFIKNYDALSADLNALEGKYDDVLAVADGENMTPSQSFKAMRAVKVPAEIQGIFNKHGMGNDGFEKFVVITASAGIAEALESLESQKGAYAEYPEMMQYMEQTKAQMEAMKAEINPADFSLVASRKSDLIPLLSAIDGDESAGDEDYGYEEDEFMYED
jgi:phage-related protein